MSEWRDIESAPKGRAVIVTFASDDISDPTKYPATSPGMMIAYFDEYYAEGGAGYDGEGDGWVDSSSGEQCSLHYGFPTHWMPLPAPPEAA